LASLRMGSFGFAQDDRPLASLGMGSFGFAQDDSQALRMTVKRSG